MTVLLQHIDLTEKAKADKLIDQLDKIALGRMYQASFKAVIRLQLFFTGRTHELIMDFGEKVQALILKKAGKGQVLDGTSGYSVQTEMLKMWGDLFKEWQDELQAVRREAASIPFGVMAVFHERLVIPNLLNREERKEREENPLEEARSSGGVFERQLQMLLDIAAEHLYGDGMNLSGRIWKWDRESREGINRVLMDGIANQKSAWDIAKNLEQYLGANEDCPRWTSTRLYGRTKTQIAAGDTTGLVSRPCDGRGVSYNALRLARTEIQKVHALATDRIMAAQPWVEKEKCNLSAAHPETDICDDVVQGGEKGEGVYEVGTIEYPLHPNCLCYKTAVLMDEKDFTSDLNSWLRGTSTWPEMDSYAELIGGDVSQSILPNAVNLAVWLFGEDLSKWVSGN